MKQRYNIMANPNYMDILNKYASELGISRSMLIDSIFLEYIKENDLSFISNNEINEQIEGQEVFLP